MPIFAPVRIRPATLIAAGLLLGTVAGCGPKIRFADSVDTSFDLIFTHPYDDRLASPYVAGASFFIYAYDSTEDNSLDGWTIVSLDQDVLDIIDVQVIRDELEEDDKGPETDIIRAEVVATGAGNAILEVHDEHGEFVRATEVVVMQPDRLELQAAGPLFIEREDLAGPISGSPYILANGTATFLVQWFAGNTKLNGAGALGLSSNYSQLAGLWERQSYLDEDRDWATLSFESPTDGNEVATVEFLANGEPVTAFDFVIVQPDDIANVELIDENTAGAQEGELLTVLAQALTADDEPIWGVAFDWDLDGYPESGEGDLFRYWFDPSVSSVLGAEYDGHRGEILILGEEGYVASSNNIACFCSAQEQQPSRGIALGLMMLASFGLVRRRRLPDPR